MSASPHPPQEPRDDSADVRPADRDVLADLARVRAAFQLRALGMILGLPASRGEDAT